MINESWICIGRTKKNTRRIRGRNGSRIGRKRGFPDGMVICSRARPTLYAERRKTYKKGKSESIKYNWGNSSSSSGGSDTTNTTPTINERIYLYVYMYLYKDIICKRKMKEKRRAKRQQRVTLILHLLLGSLLMCVLALFHYSSSLTLPHNWWRSDLK